MPTLKCSRCENYQIKTLRLLYPSFKGKNTHLKLWERQKFSEEGVKTQKATLQLKNWGRKMI